MDLPYIWTKQKLEDEKKIFFQEIVSHVVPYKQLT